MMKVGGRSYSNGISFSSTKYTVSFKTDNNITKIFLKENKLDTENKVFKFLRKVPLIRGILSILINNKLTLIILLIDVLRNVLLTDANTGIVEESSKLIVYMFCFVLLYYF